MLFGFEPDEEGRKRIETGSDEVRRSQRARTIPTRLQDYDLISDAAVNAEGDLVHFALLSEAEPVSLDQALQDPKWICAMEDELESIKRNETWQLVSLPSDKKPIGVKWVYKVKVNPSGEVVKHKAKLVARGFLQKAGIDYDEVFAPMARLETVRMVIIVSQKGRTMHQMDVKSAFLNGPLEEEVYVSQPPGFIEAGSKSLE